MAEFRCYGPFPLETQHRHGGGRSIVRDGFWESDAWLSELKPAIGIYVFAIKPPRTDVYTPCYVGQAKRSFEQEALHDLKMRKYDNALADYQKGAPYLFFLAHPKTKPNLTQIRELETYLIMMGFAVNEDIQNDQNAKLPAWSIAGLVRSRIKKPTNDAREIGKMFRIKSRKGV
jgi:hypothetical protein